MFDWAISMMKREREVEEGQAFLRFPRICKLQLMFYY